MANFNGLSVIANREAIRSGEELLGAIISFRSKDEIATLNAQLTQIKQYVESLRTLRHEHLNWMSTLNGLLQMKEYDRVREMVQGESARSSNLLIVYAAPSPIVRWPVCCLAKFSARVNWGSRW